MDQLNSMQLAEVVSLYIEGKFYKFVPSCSNMLFINFKYVIYGIQTFWSLIVVKIIFEIFILEVLIMYSF